MISLMTAARMRFSSVLASSSAGERCLVATADELAPLESSSAADDGVRGDDSSRGDVVVDESSVSLVRGDCAPRGESGVAGPAARGESGVTGPAARGESGVAPRGESGVTGPATRGDSGVTPRVESGVVAAAAVVAVGSIGGGFREGGTACSAAAGDDGLVVCDVCRGSGRRGGAVALAV